jgi:hypothetical protein
MPIVVELVGDTVPKEKKKKKKKKKKIEKKKIFGQDKTSSAQPHSTFHPIFATNLHMILQQLVNELKIGILAARRRPRTRSPTARKRDSDRNRASDPYEPSVSAANSTPPS